MLFDAARTLSQTRLLTALRRGAGLAVAGTALVLVAPTMLLAADGQWQPASVGGTAVAAQSVSPLPAPGAPAAEAPSPPPTTAPAQADATPSTPAAPQPTATPIETGSTTPAPVDPVLAQVREKLAAAPNKSRRTHRDDLKAMQEFYAAADARLLWLTPSGALNGQGRAVRTVIERADDWGLDAGAFELPAAEIAAGDETRADAEIALTAAALQYARYARGGRVDPSSLSRNFDVDPPVLPAAKVLSTLASSQTPGDALEDLHPKHPQFRLLQKALVKARSGATLAKAEAGDPSVRLPDGPVLKPGLTHPQIALLRQRLGVATSGTSADVYDPSLETAVKAFQSAHGTAPDGIVGQSTRSILNGGDKADRTTRSEESRIRLTMERWRWLAEDLGNLYVWDNIPEYRSRVVEGGSVIHQAKIIVGKADTQTPLFSADMRYIVFHPDWGVPNSIKVKEILPYLRPQQSFFGFGGSDTGVLRRHNLRVSMGGRPVDPSKIDWSQTDIRRYDFIQPPGGANVLGVLKFRFPNKHDVYMHDTPQRELFSRGARTFSHGCVRVENPRRLAEVLLQKDKGWGPEKISSLLAGPQNNQIELTTRIPVHITYATAVAAEDGTVTFHPDIYGHDNRLAMALDGKPLPLEAVADAGKELQRQQAIRRAPAPKGGSSGSGDFFTALFGN